MNEAASNGYGYDSMFTGTSYLSTWDAYSGIQYPAA